jgi:glycosyltransferase involved in cell wall biosynthesis
VAAVPARSSGRRVTIVADEMLGYVRTGGLGTATSFLAVALARMGHQVELLYTGKETIKPIGAEWSRLYNEAGVAIRPLPPSGARVEPSYFARAHRTEIALRADPPDIVITQDLAAPAYTAMRLRQLGLDFERTRFIVYCHGTRQWITDVARKARVLPGALAIGMLERASVELADVVVSPSAYLIEWMRARGWRLPESSLVIPYLTRSSATGEARPRAEASGHAVRRLTVFGRLEERKGLRPFAAGLNALDPELLANAELEFLGAATPAWPPERIEGLVSEEIRRSLRGISFATNLDQREALTRLSEPGTVAIMPSLEDNSPNAIYECLELGIPFVASNAGGGGELVAPADRDRVLFEPTAAGIESALRRVLAGSNGFEPAQFAFDPDDPNERWADVVERQTRPAPSDPEPLGELDESEWIVLLDDADVPDANLVETLMAAQAASGADVVTCGVRYDDAQHFFIGEPGGLGVVSNSYGTVALVRRSLLAERQRSWPAEGDPTWPLLARLSLAGAEIVSIPKALVEQPRPPGDSRRGTSDALAVAQSFEEQLGRRLESLARLAAGLAADEVSTPTPRALLGRARLSRILRGR